MKLDAFVELVIGASEEQNLIAASTRSTFWERHMLDSAQLLKLAGSPTGDWLDVGSGAGLPGLVIAIMNTASNVLVEPRRLRADFLRHAVGELGLEDRVMVVQSRVEAFQHAPFPTIMARAFASLADTLRATLHLSDARTTWLLHKGRNASAEIADARTVFDFVCEPSTSVTAADAFIVRCGDVSPRKRAVR